jgi:hypothetical protein
MRYADTDHFYEQQGLLICWIRNEMKITLSELANQIKRDYKEIENFEQGYQTGVIYNEMYNLCLCGLISLSNREFTSVLSKLSETKYL